jgi:hypothetical protein
VKIGKKKLLIIFIGVAQKALRLRCGGPFITNEKKNVFNCVVFFKNCAVF